MVALLFRLLTVVIIKVTTLLVGDSLKPCYCQDVMHNSPFQSPLIFLATEKGEFGVTPR